MNSKINQGAMLPVGSMLRGIYRIESYLSSGGFGNTYVATNIEFDEVVAIKEFFMRGVTQRDVDNTTVSVSNLDNISIFTEQLQKFKKEGKRLRKLKNGHIVTVHDLFEDNGTAYYVMDYIEGENLSDKLLRLQHPLSEVEVMSYLSQILEALDCIHDAGLLHLDLKPANIMVDKNGKITIIDFGASKQHNRSGGATTSTAVCYTNGFAPREQMEQNLDKFGPWTDLYALGATLYNLLSNRKPPMPSDIDDDCSVDKHLVLPMPSNVSENTRHLIQQLMTTNRFNRPQSVAWVMKMIGMSKRETADNTLETDNGEETIVINKSNTIKEPIPITTKLSGNNAFKNVSNMEGQHSNDYEKLNEADKSNNNEKPFYKKLFFLGIIVIGLVAYYFLRECSHSSETERADDEFAIIVNQEKNISTMSLEDVVAKAKAESANWTADEWKENMKKAMIAVAPSLQKVSEMMKDIGDDPQKAAEALGKLQAMQEEFAPMEKLLDELDSICNASEIGKAVMEDSVWANQVKEELGIPDDL